jgi:hypothetical protein
MIRDFWKITKPRLIDEIDALKDKVDPETWDAIDSVRKIGNIGGLWYGEPNAIDYAKVFSRSHRAVIRVYDDAGNVIEVHRYKGDFKEP